MHGECLTRLARYEEAEVALLDAQVVLEKYYNADGQFVIDVLTLLGRLYERWQMPEKAAKYRAMVAERKGGNNEG